MKAIKNILFDFDGTLADTAPGILTAEAETFRRMGLEVPSEERMRFGIGLPLGESLRQAVDLPADRIEEAMAIYRSLFSVYELGLTRIFPEVPETLEELRKRGLRMAIATSRGANSLGAILSRFDIGHYFETMTTATDNLPAKPAPDMVLALLERMDIAAEDTLVVGDTVYDIGMGANASCRTCAVTYGNHSRARLLESHPTFIIERFSQLLDIL